MTLEELSIEELLFDRQESFNDLAALAIAKLKGIENYPSGNGNVDDRIYGNLGIIQKIMDECKRRGFDPAQYDQVKQVMS